MIGRAYALATLAGWTLLASGACAAAGPSIVVDAANGAVLQNQEADARRAQQWPAFETRRCQ